MERMPSASEMERYKQEMMNLYRLGKPQSDRRAVQLPISKQCVRRGCLPDGHRPRDRNGPARAAARSKGDPYAEQRRKLR